MKIHTVVNCDISAKLFSSFRYLLLIFLDIIKIWALIYDLIFKIFVAAIEFWDLIKDTPSGFLYIVIFLSIILWFAGFPEVSKTCQSAQQMKCMTTLVNIIGKRGSHINALMMHVCTCTHTRHRPTRELNWRINSAFKESRLEFSRVYVLWTHQEGASCFLRWIARLERIQWLEAVCDRRHREIEIAKKEQSFSKWA